MSWIWVSWSRLCSTTFSASSIDSSATLAAQLAHHPVAGEPCVLGRPLADLGRVGLGLRDQLTADLFGLLARCLDDLAGLGARLGELAAVVLQHTLGLGLGLLGPLEVAADAVLAVLEHLAHRREAELPHEAEEHDEGEHRPRRARSSRAGSGSATPGSRRSSCPAARGSRCTPWLRGSASFSAACATAHGAEHRHRRDRCAHEGCSNTHGG